MPEHAATILHNDVIPQYQDWGLKINSMLTDNGVEFCGRLDHHPYELYLQLNDIEHRRTKVKSPQTNGFVERFNRTILDEFFRPDFRSKYYDDIQQLQQNLDIWLKFYNYERAHLGYRNNGNRPFDTIKKFTNLV